MRGVAKSRPNHWFFWSVVLSLQAVLSDWQLTTYGDYPLAWSVLHEEERNESFIRNWLGG